MTQNSFDASKYQIDLEPQTEMIKIEETGEEFEVKIKQLTWAKRNQLLSKSFSFGAAGEANAFDAAYYVKECLKEMIIDAPWGRTTEAFLTSIDTRLGSALEALVPAAFGDDAEDVGGGMPNEIKKE
tara:strand:+ start:2327 stop:2707 length:381 start_codon:yes stop_codon:yes gene_type:complete